MKSEESTGAASGSQDTKGEGSGGGGIQLPAVTGVGTQQARQSAKGKGGLKDKQSNSLKDIAGNPFHEILCYCFISFIYLFYLSF